MTMMPGEMSPHWEEFGDALTQFTPTFGMLPEDCETFFALENIQLDQFHQFVTRLLKYALMGKPFQKLSFVNKLGVGDNVGDGGMTIDNIIDIMNSNKHLRKLTIGNNRIQLGHMEKICSVLCRGSVNKRSCTVVFRIKDTKMSYTSPSVCLPKSHFAASPLGTCQNCSGVSPS